MNFLVSICCITYNHEKYITDAIESFLMQKTNFNFEIIIHDDASTDNTADIIREFAKEYPIVKPIFQSENQYSKDISISESYVYPKATGKYIALCEGDDYWVDPYKLQKQVDYMEANPSCSLCCHSGLKVNSDNSEIIEVMRPHKEGYISTGDIIDRGNNLPTASFLFPRNMIKELPNFLKVSPVGDYPLVMLLASKGTVYYMDTVMSAYRVGDPGSWTSRVSSMKAEHKIEIAKGIISMLDEFDKYSKFKYSKYVKKTKFSRINQMLLLSEKGIRDNRYKEHYDLLNTKYKIKLHIRSLKKILKHKDPI